MERFMLDGGIYIDWSCNGVKQLPTGVFIPVDDYNTDKRTIQFNKELNEFLNKWFPRGPKLTYSQMKRMGLKEYPIGNPKDS